MNEIAIHPAGLRLPRRVVLFQIWDLMVPQYLDAQGLLSTFSSPCATYERSSPGEEAHRVLRIKKSISKNNEKETIFGNTDFQKSEAAAQREFIL